MAVQRREHGHRKGGGVMACEHASAEPKPEWMQTFTGRKFYPMAPAAEDVDIVDIAHALSLQCRFNGHVDHFFSVAEHCILMSQSVPAEDALWALLHDATEAYVGDMISPLKHSMPEFAAAEDRVMDAICERFGLEPGMPDAVHDADRRILLTERNALMSRTSQPWDADALTPLRVTVIGLAPHAAEARYLQRFHELAGTSLVSAAQQSTEER